jgi:hypothetical protein
MGDNLKKTVELSAEERARIVERKAACPFIGSAVAQGQLPVRNSADDPLASVEDVRRLGNTGGGDLGDFLTLFANGNHLFMRGDSGKLDRRVPDGFFSLDFPGSQGSHPGHSGILQGDPTVIGSGRLSEADFARLTGRAKDGWIKISDVGRFIAENLIKDSPRSKVLSKNTVLLLASDFGVAVKTGLRALLNRLFGRKDDGPTHRDVQQKLTKFTGEDNLVGSAGEFGLLFAFLANRPGAKEIEREPAVSVQDLKEMFIDKRLPAGWETWKKTRHDWFHSTNALIKSAREEYRALKPD